jgi:hypothetical protein
MWGEKKWLLPHLFFPPLLLVKSKTLWRIILIFSIPPKFDCCYLQ